MKPKSSEGKGIKEQVISLTEYNSNPSKYGLIDTWIKFNKFGKEYFIKRLDKNIKNHYKLFPKCDKPKYSVTFEYPSNGTKMRSAEVHQWITPEKKYSQMRTEWFEHEFNEFINTIKGLSLYFDENRQSYIISKQL